MFEKFDSEKFRCCVVPVKLPSGIMKNMLRKILKNHSGSLWYHLGWFGYLWTILSNHRVTQV